MIVIENLNGKYLSSAVHVVVKTLKNYFYKRTSDVKHFLNLTKQKITLEK